jgi:ribonucleotide reductase alpha subunit
MQMVSYDSKIKRGWARVMLTASISLCCLMLSVCFTLTTVLRASTTLSSSVHASPSTQGALALLCTTFVLLTGTQAFHTTVLSANRFLRIAPHSCCELLIGFHLITFVLTIFLTHFLDTHYSYIRGSNGTSNGIVPMLRVFNDTARYVDQVSHHATLLLIIVYHYHSKALVNYTTSHRSLLYQ